MSKTPDSVVSEDVLKAFVQLPTTLALVKSLSGSYEDICHKERKLSTGAVNAMTQTLTGPLL